MHEGIGMAEEAFMKFTFHSNTQRNKKKINGKKKSHHIKSKSIFISNDNLG